MAWTDLTVDTENSEDLCESYLSTCDDAMADCAIADGGYDTVPGDSSSSWEDI